jgi:UDP-N-acetyl-2-amino-2-deoxyglucuronate dehydrogenase
MTHRIGIIGLGMAATKHVLALRELGGRTQVVGAWSPSQQRRAAFGEKFGLPTPDSADALFDDTSLDLLLILTPPWTHLDLVSRAAAARKHVLLEKPVEATLARSEELVRIAESAGITLGLVFQNRFRTPYLRLAELLHAGQLGRPISVAVSMRWWRADSYFAENGRGTVAKDGGGALLNQGIHIIDQLIGLLGPVHSVSGFQAISLTVS